ncbi:MAG: S-adenosylmethionine:tRNA ribosyltransferase-isomerase [Ignavibacteria bacterium]
MPKNDIPSIDIQRYSYDLPPNRIAEYPLTERDASKLLLYSGRDNSIAHYHFRDVASLLPQDSLLVVNSTRVIAARIVASKPSGGRVEVLLIDPLAPSVDPVTALQAIGSSTWNCMVGGRNVGVGMVLTHEISGLQITIVERNGTQAVARLDWQGAKHLALLLEEIGRLPLPPYIHRDVEFVDTERYQTVYAKEQGSVAAPTAGLHFTQRVFDQIDDRGIETVMLTLHVGLGTFQPVSVVDARNHVMHSERFGVSRQSLARIHANAASDQPWITAVGTTSLRTLESLHTLGASIASGHEPDPNGLHVDQWSAFDTSLWDVSRRASLAALTGWMDSHDLSNLWGSTSIMLAPGCRIASVDALITNFHQPGNTLMLLVAAFAGQENWKHIYEAALANDYRFLSYGDSSLLIRERISP